ncbi:MAG: peroxide stress protein YaaA [Myxococcota bacterium]
MLAVISPAKKLDLEPPERDLPFTEPRLLEDAEALVEVARRLSREDLKRLMKISDRLADLNHERFQRFEAPFTPDNAKQAVLTFAGDTYSGLDAATLDADDLAWAQGHLAILSGLYGVLRPLDLMQPYRLEMGARLDNPRGKNLYEFWGDRPTRVLNAALEQQPDPTLVNLASHEYFRVVDEDVLAGPVVTPVFKEIRDGKVKVVGLMAKRARGAMARFMITRRLESPEGLKDFDEGGYAYRRDLSDDRRWVFTREW